MKKFLLIFINCCMLFTTYVIGVESGEKVSNISSSNPTLVPVLTPPERMPGFVDYNPIIGIAQWLCYVLACVLMIFAIIKMVKMIRSKTPILSCILFGLMMFVIAIGVVYGAMFLSFI